MPWLQTLLLALMTAWSDDDGEVTIEYGILVVFVALALIAAAGVLSGSIETWFGNIGTFISGLAASN